MCLKNVVIKMMDNKQEIEPCRFRAFSVTNYGRCRWCCRWCSGGRSLQRLQSGTGLLQIQGAKIVVKKTCSKNGSLKKESQMYFAKKSQAGLQKSVNSSLLVTSPARLTSQLPSGLQLPIPMAHWQSARPSDR